VVERSYGSFSRAIPLPFINSETYSACARSICEVLEGL